MTADNFGDNADKTAHPQNASGGAQAGDDTLVLVNYKALVNLIHRVKPISWRRIRRGACLCFVLAMLYPLAFTIAGGLFPQFYQAWLDYCMPLVEYVGGLSPRAGRVTEQLIAGGYPERVDGARHGIAMARFLVVPMFMFMVAVGFSAVDSSPVFVSCTRHTHKEARYSAFFIFAVLFVIAMPIALFGEFAISEKFGSSFSAPGGVHGRPGWLLDYHHSNLAMIGDLLWMFLFSTVLAIGTLFFAQLRSFRFTIIKKLPDDES